MSMSTHIVGFIPPDADWQKHKAVWDACTSAGVPVPKETLAFFGDERPDERGREVSLAKIIKRWSAESREGYEIELQDVPPDVKVLRFYNSY